MERADRQDQRDTESGDSEQTIKITQADLVALMKKDGQTKWSL